VKLTVDRKELANGIKDVARAAASARTTLPILNNIMLVASEDQLTLSATDLEIGITRTIEAKVTEEGRTTVPAATFSDIVTVAGNGDQVNMRLLKNEMLKLKMGNVTSKIKGITAEDWECGSGAGGCSGNVFNPVGQFFPIYC